MKGGCLYFSKHSSLLRLALSNLHDHRHLLTVSELENNSTNTQELRKPEPLITVPN